MQSSSSLGLAAGVGALAGMVVGMVVGTLLLSPSSSAPSPVPVTAEGAAPAASAATAELTTAMQELGRDVTELSARIDRAAGAAGRTPVPATDAELAMQLGELVAVLRGRGAAAADAGVSIPRLQVPAAAAPREPLPEEGAKDYYELFREHALMDQQQVLDRYGMPTFVGGEPKTQWLYRREDGSSFSIFFVGGLVASVDD